VLGVVDYYCDRLEEWQRDYKVLEVWQRYLELVEVADCLLGRLEALLGQ
jgi:hypothetical protein